MKGFEWSGVAHQTSVTRGPEITTCREGGVGGSASGAASLRGLKRYAPLPEEVVYALMLKLMLRVVCAPP